MRDGSRGTSPSASACLMGCFADAAQKCTNFRGDANPACQPVPHSLRQQACVLVYAEQGLVRQENHVWLVKRRGPRLSMRPMVNADELHSAAAQHCCVCWTDVQAAS